ncbi:MAG TPA: hypothetical protein VKX17_21420 [Planctomycetota bacterium]|nr:hypothetical protein [Planctomycetota bacterium]
MRIALLLNMCLIVSAFTVDAAESETKPKVIAVTDEETQKHFKNLLRKQMAVGELSKNAETLEQTLKLIGGEAAMVPQFKFAAESDGWLFYTNGELAPENGTTKEIFQRGYAIKKGTNKLLLFGYCW